MAPAARVCAPCAAFRDPRLAHATAVISSAWALARRYINGQRTRYLAPLPLFLFCEFLLFLVYSLVPSSHVVGAGDAAASRSELTREIERDRAQIERAQTRVGPGAAKDDSEAAHAHLDLAAAQAARDALDQSLAAQKAGEADADLPASIRSGRDDIDVHTGSAQLDRKLRSALANPELLLYKLRSAASKLAFVLVPISLPFLWLMFLGRRGITLYDHAVFSLYSLSFMSLLFIVAALVGAIGHKAIMGMLVMLVPPLHMFWQLRETYELGVAAALWRTVALLFVAGGAFLLFLMLIVVLALR